MGNFMSCVLICGAMEVVQVVNTNGRVEKLIRPIRAAELIWAHEKYKAALAAGLTPAAAAAAAAEDDDDHVAKDGVAAAPEEKANKYVLLPLSNPKDDPNNNPSSKSSSISELGCRGYKFQCLSEENVNTHQHKKQGSRSHSSSSSTTSSSSSSKQKQQQQMSSGGNPPFKVKKEGGVTTLVVSKRYLEQLLSEKELRTTEMGSGDTCTTQDAAPQELLPKLVPSSRPPRRSSLSRSGRVSIWRPALESISEAHNNSSSSSSSNHHHHHHHRHQRQQF